jgi:hypothetical protein
MYLYIEEEVTGKCGDVLYNKYHAVNLDNLPTDAEERLTAYKDLGNKLSGYGYQFSGLMDDVEGMDLDSTWNYDPETHTWIEKVLVTIEARREQWNKMWRI